MTVGYPNVFSSTLWTINICTSMVHNVLMMSKHVKTLGVHYDIKNCLNNPIFLTMKDNIFIWWPSGTLSWSLGLLVSGSLGLFVSLTILSISPSLHLSISWPYSRYLSLSPSIDPDWSKHNDISLAQKYVKCWLVIKSACIWVHTKSITWLSTESDISAQQYLVNLIHSFRSDMNHSSIFIIL